jgi:hypothetical protein
VKIKLVHDVCEREVLVQQILESSGHCPWDGLAFTSEYTGIFTEALQTVEGAGTALENALETIAGVDAALRIDRDSVLAPLEAQVDAINARKRAAVTS